MILYRVKFDFGSVVYVVSRKHSLDNASKAAVKAFNKKHNPDYPPDEESIVSIEIVTCSAVGLD
jgi:hypothetical protein